MPYAYNIPTVKFSISPYLLAISLLSFENNLFNLFKQNNLNVKVYGSEVYENRK